MYRLIPTSDSLAHFNFLVGLSSPGAATETHCRYTFSSLPESDSAISSWEPLNPPSQSYLSVRGEEASPFARCEHFEARSCSVSFFLAAVSAIVNRMMATGCGYRPLSGAVGPY
jgi:hypothetical protein